MSVQDGAKTVPDRLPCYQPHPRAYQSEHYDRVRHNHLSSGKQIITESKGQDTLVFAGGITFSQVASRLLKSGNDLILRVDNNPESQVTIKDYFGHADKIIEIITFEKGGQLDYQQIYQLFGLPIPTNTPSINLNQNVTQKDSTIIGTKDNDAVNGTLHNDELIGLLGDDVLSANQGNDILIGGAGNDTLTGGAGDDLYYFSRGFGQDVIDNTGGGYDNIYFSDINFSEIASRLIKQNDDLILQVAGEADKLTLKDFFDGGDTADINISFAGGEQLEHEAGNALPRQP